MRLMNGNDNCASLHGSQSNSACNSTTVSGRNSITSIVTPPPVDPGMAEMQISQSNPVIINSNANDRLFQSSLGNESFTIGENRHLNPASLPSRLQSSWSYTMGRRSGRSSNMSPQEFCAVNTLEMEAIAAVHEMRMFVKDVYISDLLPRAPDIIFINVTSLEGQAYCIELTVRGWRVTSLRHDCMNADIDHIQLHTKYFESIYALMDVISPAYRQGFSELLSWRLKTLDNTRAKEAKESAVFEDLEKDADSSDNSCDAVVPEKPFDDGAVSFQVDSAGSDSLQPDKLGLDCQHRVSLQSSPMVRDDSEASLQDADTLGKLPNSFKE